MIWDHGVAGSNPVTSSISLMKGVYMQSELLELNFKVSEAEWKTQAVCRVSDDKSAITVLKIKANESWFIGHSISLDSTTVKISTNVKGRDYVGEKCYLKKIIVGDITYYTTDTQLLRIDRRASERIKTDRSAVVQKVGTSKYIEARIVDVSTSGMGVQAKSSEIGDISVEDKLSISVVLDRGVLRVDCLTMRIFSKEGEDTSIIGVYVNNPNRQFLEFIEDCKVE